MYQKALTHEREAFCAIGEMIFATFVWLVGYQVAWNADVCQPLVLRDWLVVQTQSGRRHFKRFVPIEPVLWFTATYLYIDQVSRTPALGRSSACVLLVCLSMGIYQARDARTSNGLEDPPDDTNGGRGDEPRPPGHRSYSLS